MNDKEARKIVASVLCNKTEEELSLLMRILDDLSENKIDKDRLIESYHKNWEFADVVDMEKLSI